jgi:hypothetical protein
MGVATHGKVFEKKGELDRALKVEKNRQRLEEERKNSEMSQSALR